MIYEKKKILRRIIVAIAVFLVGLLLAIVPWHGELEIVDHNGYINSYNSYSDVSIVELEITFNQEVDSGDITIAFYDKDGYLIDTVTEWFYYGYPGNTLSDSYIVVDGEVASYEILYYDVTMPSSTTLSIVGSGIMLIDLFGLIVVLLLNCKVYYYEDKEIVVYAGIYHHYIKINGEKYDEHNTPISFVHICLSCECDEDYIESTITTFNRITLKVNGKLQTPSKYQKERVVKNDKSTNDKEF